MPHTNQTGYMQTGEYHCFTCHENYPSGATMHECDDRPNPTPCTPSCGKYHKGEKYGFSQNLRDELHKIVKSIGNPNFDTDRWTDRILILCESEMVEPGAVIRAIDEARKEEKGKWMLAIVHLSSDARKSVLETLSELKLDSAIKKTGERFGRAIKKLGEIN